MYAQQQVYATLHPLAPLGGLFVATMGGFLLLGAFLPKLRMILTYMGFAAGTIALVLGGRLAVGLPPPTNFQIAALVVAIVLEIAIFILFMPPLRRRGERAVLVGTLAIVGAHFLVMLPAFGALIFALGLLCLLNAAIAWRKASYRIETAWALDGAMKLGVGVLLTMTSPVFVR